MAGLVLAGIFIAAAWPLVLTRCDRGRGAVDQMKYHEVAIRQFAAEWPAVDLYDYRSATTPGYHLALAVVARYISDSGRVLQLVGSLFTAALVGVLGYAAAGRAPPRVAVAVSVPIVASAYVFSSGVWLLPDNLGWLGVLGLVLLALRERFDWITVVGGGLTLVALVCVRQSHLWAAVLIWLSAWLGTGARDVAPAVAWWKPTRARLARLAIGVVASIPAFIAVGLFVRLWGGLTPPTFQRHVPGGNAATPAFVLSLIGAYGVFYLPMYWDRLREFWRGRSAIVLIAALVGAAAAIIPETSYDPAEGRWGGVWSVIAHFPAPFDRSSIILVGSIGGAVVLAGLWSLLAWRDCLVLGAALAGLTAAQTTNSLLWQRYVEPLVIMALALAAARGWSAVPQRARRYALIGPLVLTAGLAVATGAMILAAQPAAEVLNEPGVTGLHVPPDADEPEAPEPDQP